MVAWPEGDEVLDFKNIVDPVVRAIRFAYSLERKNETKDIPWNGPGNGKYDRSCVPDPCAKLNVDSLKYSEERDRDALTEIIGVAVRLGIEQGRRMTMSDVEITSLRFRARMGDLYVDHLEKTNRQKPDS